MKKIQISKIEPEIANSREDIKVWMKEHLKAERLDQLNWPAFPYKPEVSFSIAHSTTDIWLHYKVSEKNILAQETRTNGDVYKDSCLEFFLSLDGKNYYNFEFSCIGTIHVGYGDGRNNRIPVNPELAEKIEVISSLGSEPFEEKQGDFQWDMFLRIPLSCLVHDEIASLDGLEAKANFYKCGDETSDPHFVTWNAIDTEQPDYHRPEFFGELLFQS